MEIYFLVLILCVGQIIANFRITLLEKKMKQVREISKWDRS